MNLHHLAVTHAERSGPIGVALIGAGKFGSMLDGEGGFTVWGKLIPAHRGNALEALPIDLAKDVLPKRPVAAGTLIRLSDVELNQSCTALDLRRETRAMTVN